MRTSRFTPEQMVVALRQAESGTAVEEVCRKLGISEATFHLTTSEPIEVRATRLSNTKDQLRSAH